MKNRMVQLCLVVALVLGAFSLAGCGGDTSSPENAVNAMHEAIKAQDKERLKSVMSKEDLKDMKEDKEFKQDKDQDGDYKVGTATITGDEATVEVSYSKDGKETSKMKYACVKEDGEWKVSMKKTMAAMLKELVKGLGDAGSNKEG